MKFAPTVTSSREYMRVLFAAALFLLAGCGGGSPEAKDSSIPFGNDSTTFTEPEPAPAVMTAEELGEALASQIATVRVTVVYTEESDPNDLLGRPNGYTSKIAFSDSRVDKDDTQGTEKDAIERGGSIEVYPDAEGAKARSDYIQGILKGASILGSEYHYLDGSALVRVTGKLTPTVAKDYERALAAI